MPECQPHTSLLVERRQSDEANQYMGMIRSPMRKFVSDAGVTPLLFFEGYTGIFNDHRESSPWFNVSSERRMTAVNSCQVHFILQNKAIHYLFWKPFLIYTLLYSLKFHFEPVWGFRLTSITTTLILFVLTQITRVSLMQNVSPFHSIVETT